MSNIDVKNLTVKYGDFTAVKDVSFSVKPGEIVGIFGSNGAGKSSLLRTVGGVVPCANGTVQIAGYDLGDAAQTDQARSLIGYSPDVGGLIRSSTINEHISMALVVHNELHLRDQALEMVDAYKLLGHLHVQTAGFSHGQSRNLSVLLALLVAKSALILDEPFDGVDVNHTATTMEYIRQAKENGLSVIISTHMRERLAEISDRIIVMYAGKIVGEGPASDFCGKKGEEHYKEILAAAAEAEGEIAPRISIEEERAAVITGTKDEYESLNSRSEGLVRSTAAVSSSSTTTTQEDILSALDAILSKSQSSSSDRRDG